MAEPLLTFYQLLSEGATAHSPPPRFPERASTDASGTLPAKALRYCEVVRTACSFGYHLYPAMDIGLRFDGVEILWSMDEDGTGPGDRWYPLHRSMFYPGSVENWKNTAPDNVREMVPPFLSPTQTRGMLQIWTGAIVHTRENWSVLIRGPVNDSRRSLGYEIMEGMIETDRWGAHLFANINILKSDSPIFLHSSRPFLQITPIHRDNYGNSLLNDFKIERELPPEAWQRFGEVILGNQNGSRRLGEYAVDARLRRAETRE